jgi:hypothetical protein
MQKGLKTQEFKPQGETTMTLRKIFPPVLLSFLLVFVANGSHLVLAQDENKPSQPSRTQTKDDQTNLDTQLYLVVGTNQDVGEAKLPPALDSVIKQLRASLPFKNYRLATTLINRVRSDGRLSLKWAGGPLMAAAAATARTPGFNDFNIRQVRVLDEGEGHKIINMEGFSFGARIPIETYSGVAANGNATPVINYENTGLSTDISMRENEPVVVGTLNVGPSGDAIILVMSARRALQ